MTNGFHKEKEKSVKKVQEKSASAQKPSEAKPFVIRQHTTEQTPKLAAMVVASDMTQFMGDDVLDQTPWCEDDTPVESQLAAWSSTSPAGFHLSNLEGLVSRAKFAGELSHHRFQVG